MQIDFHHTVTYTLARLAGFEKQEAEIIAYSAQYVDDAVHEGTLMFENRAAYRFIASAHKMVDYRNFEELANHKVWIPFHFMPGNQVDKSLLGRVPEFVQKIICRPNSEVAQEVVKNCIAHRQREYALHHLGIVAHVYADTWAHQGFAGITHLVNQVEEIFDSEGNIDHHKTNRRDEYYKQGKYRPFWKNWLEKIQSSFVNEVAPVGHGPVLSFPDRPYLVWKYRDWKGDIIHRDNPKDFMDAVDHLFNAFVNFRNGTHGASNSMGEADRNAIEDLLRNNNDEDGNVRHAVWLREIKQGRFSFGGEELRYIEHGPESWLHASLGFHHADEFEYENVKFNKEFMKSHWKFIHDALHFHRFTLLHEILPKFDICVD